jgi:hypothetical protein
MYGYASDRQLYHLAQSWSCCNSENKQCMADVSATATVENPALLTKSGFSLTHPSIDCKRRSTRGSL